jgi:hypothetical protein
MTPRRHADGRLLLVAIGHRQIVHTLCGYRIAAANPGASAYAPTGAVWSGSSVAMSHQLKQRLRPMRGLRTDRTTQVVIAGHAFLQNLRRGHYELARRRPARAADRRCVHRTRSGDLGGAHAGLRLPTDLSTQHSRRGQPEPLVDGTEGKVIEADGTADVAGAIGEPDRFLCPGMPANRPLKHQ